ncbi:MAG: divalent-cation tolerance protein CutA [Myxococcota bacterium]
MQETEAPPPTEPVCVLFATIDAEHADAFARAACEKRLVACVNMLPGARSLYWWKSELCEDAEVVLWMETRARDVEACIASLAALHPYDTPKIIALSPGAVWPPYQRWCVEQVTRDVP